MKSSLFIGLLIASSSVLADSKTTNMNATATLNKTCQFNVGNVEFGDYQPNSAIHQESTQEVKIKCTKGASWNYYHYSHYYSIAGFSDTVAAMLNGTNKLYYQVQVADGNWDNDVDRPGSSSLGHYIGVGNGQTQTLSIKYRIIKDQYVKAGGYTETVAAYIVF